MTIMNMNDYIKYLTEQLVKLINHSTDDSQFTEEQEMDQVRAYSNHWFGLFPFSIKFLKREKSDL